MDLCCLAGKLDEVYMKLVDANPNMMVYKKEGIPAHFHYQHNPRIMPVLLEAKEGWTIMQNRSETFMCKYLSLDINVNFFFILNRRVLSSLLIASLEIFVESYIFLQL